VDSGNHAFLESKKAAFPGAINRTSVSLQPPLLSRWQTATSLVFGSGIINGASVGLWLRNS
jgi:hypothetical protein